MLWDSIFWYIEKFFFIQCDQYSPDMTAFLITSSYMCLALDSLRNNIL